MSDIKKIDVQVLSAELEVLRESILKCIDPAASLGQTPLKELLSIVSYSRDMLSTTLDTEADDWDLYYGMAMMQVGNALAQIRFDELWMNDSVRDMLRELVSLYEGHANYIARTTPPLHHFASLAVQTIQKTHLAVVEASLAEAGLFYPYSREEAEAVRAAMIKVLKRMRKAGAKAGAEKLRKQLSIDIFSGLTLMEKFLARSVLLDDYQIPIHLLVSASTTQLIADAFLTTGYTKAMMEVVEDLFVILETEAPRVFTAQHPRNPVVLGAKILAVRNRFTKLRTKRKSRP